MRASLRLFVLLLLVCLPLAGQIGGSLHALEHVEGAECGHHVHSDHGEEDADEDCRLCLLQPVGVTPSALTRLEAPIELDGAEAPCLEAARSRGPLAFQARGPPLGPRAPSSLV